MRGFNSVQIVLLFALMPFLMSWVLSATFYAHTVVFWIMVVAYVISFFSMVYAVYDTFRRDGPWDL